MGTPACKHSKVDHFLCDSPSIWDLKSGDNPGPTGGLNWSTLIGHPRNVTRWNPADAFLEGLPGFSFVDVVTSATVDIFQ